MADPTSFQPQSTNRLASDTSPDTYRVLQRGSIPVLSTEFTLTGSWYEKIKTVDLNQFSLINPVMFEFYISFDDSLSTTIVKGPTMLTSSAGAMTYNFYGYISQGLKGGNMNVNFVLGSTVAHNFTIYYQILSMPSSGGLFN